MLHKARWKVGKPTHPETHGIYKDVNLISSGTHSHVPDSATCFYLLASALYSSIQPSYEKKEGFPPSAICILSESKAPKMDRKTSILSHFHLHMVCQRSA